MTILTTFPKLPQLKAIPVPGSISFRYLQKVHGEWIPCNHGDARRAVVAFNAKG